MAAGICAIRERSARAFDSCEALYDVLSRDVESDDLVVVFSGGEVFAKVRERLEAARSAKNRA